MELQLLQRQLQAVHGQIEALESQANEMDIVHAALDDFSQTKKGSDMFVTLTPGLFVKAKLEENESVVLNVGGGAMVQKSISQAKEIVVNQGSELRKLQGELSEQMSSLQAHAEKAQEELRKLVE